MTDQTQNQVIVINQGLIKSMIGDTFTLGMLMALPWFNYRFCGGSGWINFAIALAWIVGIVSRASGSMKKARKTPDEARAWLDENFPPSKPHD
jgi:hypothetical protein